MSDESNSAEGSPSVDLGILPEGPTEADPATEPSQEAEAQQTEEPTQTDGGEEETPAQQDADGVVDTPDVAVEGEGAPETKFTFLGKEYDSQEAAEQALGSWEGRIKAEQTRRQDSNQRLEEYWRYVEEARAKNQELVKRLEELEKGEPAEKEEPKNFVESIDWEQVQRVQQIAEQQGYDPLTTGVRMVVENMDKHYQGKMDELRAELSAPIEAQQDQQAFDKASEEIFVWAQSQENEDGTPFYPELARTEDGVTDPVFATNMYSAWRKLAEQNPEFGFSPESMDYAYRLAKEFHESAVSSDGGISPDGGTPTESETLETGKAPSQATVARDAKGRFVSSEDAAVEAASTGTQAVDPTTPGAPVDESAALLAKWDKIKTVQHGDEDLGFFE
jgi:hypothetical protein